MAKKKSFTLSDFQFDKSLDVPDFNFEIKPPKDNRKPITKVASGLKEGFSSTAMSNAFVKQMVRTALPRGYGSAYDLAEKSASTLKSLYDDTTKEIRPFMNDLKRTTARLLPKVEEVMPPKLAEKVKRWTKTADANPTSSSYNPREAEISEMLAGLVTAQAQLQHKQNADNDVKDRLREGLEQVRHRDKLKQMDALRLGISQLVDYQTNVTANYHRKSLELQYRHYFVAVDALEETKRNNAEMKAALAAIVHNTALPEQVKLSASDSFKDMAKKQAMGMIGNAIFGRTNDFTTNLFGNLKKTSTGRVKNMFGMGRGIMGDLNAGLDGMDMAEAMGIKTDPHYAGGMTAGVVGTSLIGEWLANKLKPHMAKMPTVRKYGNKLQYGAENIPQILNEWARTGKGENNAAGGLIRFLKANIRMSSKLQTGIQKDSVASLNEPSFFSRHAAKSLTEIIPGYLSRMLRELQIIRTGDSNVELTHYDYNKNKFDTQSNVRKNAFSSLVSGSEKSWTTSDVDALIDQVDPKKTLNPEQRKILGQQLLRNNARGRLGSVDVLGKSGKYDGAATPHAEQFSQLFRSYFKNDPDSAKKHQFAERYNNLGAYASASREKIQHYANVGMTDFLGDAGLLSEDGDKADLERYFSYFYGDEYAPGVQTAGGPARGMRRARRRGAARPMRQQFVGQGVTGRARNASPQIEVRTDNSDLIKAIQANSAAEPTTKMLQAILRIEERIQQGLPTFTVGSVEAGDVPAAAAGQDKTRWWNRSIKDAAKGLTSNLWGGMKSAGRIGNWLVGGGFGSVNKVSRFLGGMAGKMGQKVIDRMRGFRDVYSEETGPNHILLFAAKLKAGEYFDVNTGKPIHSWKDIQGAVADASGVVMTEEQARTAYVKDTLGKRAIKGFGAIVKTAARLGNALGGGLFSALPGGWAAVTKVAGFAGKLLGAYMNGPQDVYVRDKEHPQRLRKALDAKIMRAGGYKSAINDHVIKGPKDIDGEVYNYKGVTVLDEEEFKTGLFDRNGDPLKHGLGRLLGGASKILGAGVGAMKWLAGGINQGIGNMMGLGKGFLSGFAGLFGRHGIFFGGGKKLLNTVEEIRDLLQDRLPKPRRIRAGSIEDQHNKRKEAEEALRGAASGNKDGEGRRSGLLSLLGGLLGRRKKDDKDGNGQRGIVDDIEQGVAQSIGEKLLGKTGRFLRKIPGIGRLFGGGAAAAAEGVAGGAVAGAAKRGLFSRLLGGLKWGKGLGLGAALGGASMLANGTGHDTLGKGLEYGADAATGWGLASGAASLLGVEGGAMGLAAAGGGALLSGLGAIIGSPLLLPALGVAALGAGAYFGYKFLTRNKLDALSKVRYVQYGWKADDTDYVSKVFAFEDALMPGVTYVGGMAKIDPKKVNLKKAVENLGVDPKDKDQINAFATWYMQRFKPVFITHLTVLNGIKPGVGLRDADSKLNAEEKKKYLEGVRIPSGPYGVMTSPIPGQKELSAGPDDVKKAFDDATAEIDKDAKDKKPEDAASANKPASTVATTAGVAAGAAAASTALDKINQQAAGNKPDLTSSGSAVGSAAAITAGAVMKSASNAQVSAIDAIRFKTYGLKELDADKVSSLRQLEDLVQADVKVNNGKAEWNGDASALVAKIAPQFGFSGNRNNRAYDWMAWFHKRFLPTYLTFVTGVCSVTGKKDPKSAMVAIKPDDLFNVAKQVVSASTSAYGSSTSVWQIPTSPWEGYDLNSESGSTDGNMASLKQAQKTDKLPEKAAFEKKTTAANDSKNQSQEAKNQGPSWMDKLKNGISNAWESTKKFAGDVWQGAKNAAGSAGAVVSAFGSQVAQSAGDVLRGAGQGIAKAGQAVGNVVGELGKGAAGLFSKLPMPTASGTYAAVKDLLSGVANMTGVPEKLLATMAAIESGFRWNVKAGTSSATGLFQFISSTWKTMLQKYGPKYGIDPSTPPTDPRANALMGAEYVKENMAGLQSVKKDVTDTDLYLAHFLGLGGARQFLKANPSDIAANVMPAAARANANIFYENGRPRTFAEVYQHLNTLVQSKGAKFGTSGGTAPAAAPSATGTNAGGFMQVADQTPGPAPATKGSQAGPSQDSSTPAAASTPANAVTSDTASTTGFTNRSKDLAAQSQYQADQLSKSLGPVADVLKQSLDVQKQMRDALLQIAKNFGQSAPQSSAPTPTGNASPDAMSRKNPQAMPTPPVPMSKTV